MFLRLGINCTLSVPFMLLKNKKIEIKITHMPTFIGRNIDFIEEEKDVTLQFSYFYFFELLILLKKFELRRITREFDMIKEIVREKELAPLKLE